MNPKDQEPDAPASDGVDVTLIRWMLSLTPAERLQVLEDYLEVIRTARELNA